MKKYVFWLLLCTLPFGCILFHSTPAYACTAMEIEQWTCEEGWSSNNTTEQDACKTMVTSSMSPSDTKCTVKPEDDKKACWEWANSSSNSTLCSKRYSCESLFTNNDTAANDCNLARCKSLKWDDSPYCQCKYVAHWIPLNTSIPFLWSCLQKSNPSDPNDTEALSAFPTIVSVATRILVTVIMLAWFIMIIVWWVQWSAGNAKAWKQMITKVAIWFALLGTMWAILRLINPNFFK